MARPRKALVVCIALLTLAACSENLSTNRPYILTTATTENARIQRKPGVPSSATIWSGSQWAKRKWVASSARRPTD